MSEHQQDTKTYSIIISCQEEEIKTASDRFEVATIKSVLVKNDGDDYHPPNLRDQLRCHPYLRPLLSGQLPSAGNYGTMKRSSRSPQPQECLRGMSTLQMVCSILILLALVISLSALTSSCWFMSSTQSCAQRSHLTSSTPTPQPSVVAVSTYLQMPPFSQIQIELSKMVSYAQNFSFPMSPFAPQSNSTSTVT